MTRVRPGRRTWLTLGAGAAAALIGAVFGCNTPYIPIPPPGNPTFTPIVTMDPMGSPHTAWEARGTANEALAEAKVSIYNASLGQGVIARAQLDGSYVAGPFEGTAKDRIELSYENKKGELSPTVCVLLQPGLASPCP
jgi:hypothetical protein